MKARAILVGKPEPDIPAGVRTGVLPFLITQRGARTAAAGLYGRMPPVTIQRHFGKIRADPLKGIPAVTIANLRLAPAANFAFFEGLGIIGPFLQAHTKVCIMGIDAAPEAR